jgi:hypothetical protein
VSFAAITLCVASQRVFIAVVYFLIDSVRKLFGYTLVFMTVTINNQLHFSVEFTLRKSLANDGHFR